ncbi:Peroxidase 2 [Triticum urartu]|uniref:Peroxidase n=1 Tax=Triticum urartu TaxID=4572 RepID=M7YXV7_TRIUA|nr:Peroxidase 2 [Triticum urartu]
MVTKLAALIVLAAFLGGPPACEGDIICFNGWLKLPIQDPRLCPQGSRSRMNGRTRALVPVPRPSGLGLGLGYYNNRSSKSYCPRAEGIVRDAVSKAVAAQPGIGAGLIRLFFHDCFVRGCDASVLLKTTNSNNSDTEMEGNPNKNSLRGLEAKGLTSDEMVTLSGAHTIGRARCAFFSSRFSEMDPTFAAKLRAQCNDDNTNVDQEHVTPEVLDMRYYQDVIDGKALFTSDAVLNSAETIKQVTENAKKAGAWERKFERAMENLGKIGVKTKADQGAEIRKVH